MDPGEFQPLIITVALTGAVPDKQRFPNLPTTPEEIAQQAYDCADAGAAIVHLHMRDADGRPTQDADLFGETIGMIRAQRPELIICATTTSRYVSNPVHRAASLTLPKPRLPDLASLTLGSYNTPHGVNLNPPEEIESLAHQMLEVGVVPEIEVFEFGMIETLYRLIERGVVPQLVLVNLLLGVRGASPAKAWILANMVQSLPASVEWAAAGIGRFQKTTTALAVAMGGNVRVGMEDDPRGDWDGWRNIDAVHRVRRFSESLNREVASARDARNRLGLEPVVEV